MHILVKSGLGIGTIAGVSGLGYGIYSNVQSKPEVHEEKTETPSYAEKLSGTLLSVEDGQNSTEWGKRLEKLKVAREEDLVESLKLIKGKKSPSEATQKDVQNWCKDNIKNPSKDEKNKEFLNIQSYCVFSIKEKISNAVNESEDEGSEKWKKGHDVLLTINDENQLDEKLKEAKKKKDAEAKKAIKEWCTAEYQKPYKGEKDQGFINAKKLCIDNV
ncbi:hypothetical protein A6V39_05180 [Candidatus Mycoplasma haematobovis]|uniref:Uncharacterized protein n=1 Tax=Candidatus Mycoplasma haematobovis TaxID=432608 RepID=A0A1A9QCT3_9MOLU|nr:hypothetical protein [Candidatus Mycoplasma haematobovis]OAL09821.1 hypothetical protein A6V39_05180 [Candidatus Mycoplasma haematobovis]